MALTTLDKDTALVLIDLQRGILQAPTAQPVSGVLEHARALADAFRGYGLPVVLVNVAGGAPGRVEQGVSLANLPDGWTELAPELNRQPDDHTVTKRQWGAFIATDLQAWLKSRGVTQIVLGGVSTSKGVESSARQAYELGFNVTLAVDAMTDTDAETHHNSVTRIFPRLGECGSTEEILQLLKTTRQ